MILILVSCSMVLIDQITKLYVRKSLNVGESIPVIDNMFYITHVRNRGAAFGLMPDQHLILFFMTLFIVIIILLFYFLRRPKEVSIQLALGLVLGGAVGNILDRLFVGAVVDFLDFRIWPVFNIADSAIVIGTIILLWSIKTGINSKKT